MRYKVTYNSCTVHTGKMHTYSLHSGGGDERHASEEASVPQLPKTPSTRAQLWKQNSWWTTEFSPVYANPTEEEEGRMVTDTDAGDDVSLKTTRGRQRESTSL